MFTQATFAKFYDGINNSKFRVVLQFDGDDVECYQTHQGVMSEVIKFDEFGTHGFYKKDVIWAFENGDMAKITGFADKFAFWEQVRQGYRFP